MSLEYEAQRGSLAKSVLDNPVYQDAYVKIEAGLTQAWRDSRNQEEREEIHRLIRMLDKVKGSLESVMRSGEVADAKLGRRPSAIERLGRTLSGD